MVCIRNAYMQMAHFETEAEFEIASAIQDEGASNSTMFVSGVGFGSKHTDNISLNQDRTFEQRRPTHHQATALPPNSMPTSGSFGQSQLTPYSRECENQSTSSAIHTPFIPIVPRIQAQAISMVTYASVNNPAAASWSGNCDGCIMRERVIFCVCESYSELKQKYNAISASTAQACFRHSC